MMIVNPTYRKLCGKIDDISLTQVTIRQAEAVVEFRTDRSINQSGFAIQYRSGKFDD